VGKDYYGNKDITLDNLILIIKFKSFLRINALKSFSVAYDARTFNHFYNMSYFLTKVYIKYEITLQERTFNLIEKLEQNPNTYQYSI
jgi:hypothetical protein